ncbi:MAG TPA: hypothetical protein VF988_01025 [Verrucomicrobiae bacterium]
MNALIIYEHRHLALLAKSMLERAADQATGATWQTMLWRMDLIVADPTVQLALRQAAEAHLIMIALGDHNTLPPQLLAWLERWAECRKVPDAALAMFVSDQDNEDIARAARDCAQFAERHGLNFIRPDAASQGSNANPNVS